MAIVISLPDHENEYQVLQLEDARAAAARHGLAIEILDAAGSPMTQIQQLLKWIRSDPKPEAIVVEPLSVDAMESVATKAAQAGIGLAVLNCTLPGLAALRERQPGVPIFSVGSDQVEIGRVQGRQLRALAPDGGQVLYIHGPQSATAARERFEGFQQATEGHPIELTILDARWSESSAERAVASWLRLKTWEGMRLAAVAAQDDSMARGARTAIETMPGLAFRWSEVPFLGIDGVPEVGQKLVRDGELTATVVMPSNTGPAVDIVARWLKSGALPMVSVHLPARSFPDELELARRGSDARRSA